MEKRVWKGVWGLPKSKKIGGFNSKQRGRVSRCGKSKKITLSVKNNKNNILTCPSMKVVDYSAKNNNNKGKWAKLIKLEKNDLEM
jgi:hypothetical protein